MKDDGDLYGLQLDVDSLLEVRLIFLKLSFLIGLTVDTNDGDRESHGIHVIDYRISTLLG